MRNIVNALLLHEDKILLARRSQHRKAYPDRWSFPGGHVETGETIEAGRAIQPSWTMNIQNFVGLLSTKQARSLIWPWRNIGRCS